MPTRTNTPQWRPITISNRLVVQGGYLKHPLFIETTQVSTPSGAMVDYCRIDKNEPWLIKATAGPTGAKGALKRSKVIDQLRGKLKAVSDGVLDNTSDSPPVMEDDDPMNALIGYAELATDEQEQIRAKKAKRTAKLANSRMSDRVYTITMPKHALASTDTDSETYTATVLRKSTNSMWIHRNDIEWLITYVADEVSSGGVPPVGEDESEVADCNCEVPHLNLKWDFPNQRWTGRFVSGPRAGEVMNADVANMTAEKWATLDAADVNLGDWNTVGFDA